MPPQLTQQDRERIKKQMEIMQKASVSQETDETSPEPVQLPLPGLPPPVSYLPPREIRLDLMGLLTEHREGLLNNAQGAMNELEDVSKVVRFLKSLAIPSASGPVRPSRIEVVLDAPDLPTGVPPSTP